MTWATPCEFSVLMTIETWERFGISGSKPALADAASVNPRTIYRVLDRLRGKELVSLTPEGKLRVLPAGARLLDRKL